MNHKNLNIKNFIGYLSKTLNMFGKYITKEDLDKPDSDINCLFNSILNMYAKANDKKYTHAKSPDYSNNEYKNLLKKFLLQLKNKSGLNKKSKSHRKKKLYIAKSDDGKTEKIFHINSDTTIVDTNKLNKSNNEVLDIYDAQTLMEKMDNNIRQSKQNKYKILNKSCNKKKSNSNGSIKFSELNYETTDDIDDKINILKNLLKL